jgi:membrane protein DedA with SNARE-associated domain
MEGFIVSIIQNYLLLGVFVLLLACGMGMPMPEDIILVTAGYVSYMYPSSVNIYYLLFISMAGVLLGDSVIFHFGRRFGPRVMKLPVLRGILTPARLEKMEGYFQSYGDRIIFMGRFMAGVRAPLFMTAGVLGHPYGKFILYDGLAATISVPLLVLMANHFGEEIDQLKHMLIRTQKALFIIIPAVVIIWLVFRKFAVRREADSKDDYPGST